MGEAFAAATGREMNRLSLFAILPLVSDWEETRKEEG